MNQYTEVLIYIKTLAEQDNFIHTVTQGDTSDYDLDKGNIFPLLNIDINNAGFTNGNTITFDIEIGCCDLREKNNETRTDKFWLQDNKVDNQNTMLASLNRIWFKLLQDFENNNIRVDETASLEQVNEWNKNLVDGWLMTFTIEVPNTTICLS
jgi:thymidylate kinase